MFSGIKKSISLLLITGILVCVVASCSLPQTNKNKSSQGDEGGSTTATTTEKSKTDNGIANNVAVTEDSDDEEDVEETTTVADDLSNAFGKTVVFDDLELTFGKKVKFVKLKNQFSEYNGKKVIQLSCHVKNIGDKKNMLNIFYIKIFGSKGTEIDELGAYFEKKGIFYAGELRPGAETDVAFYFPYDGDGKYSIVFDNWTSEVEVGFDIKK